MPEIDHKKEILKEAIGKDGLFFKTDGKIVTYRGYEGNWTFDLRRILLDSRILPIIAEIFWHRFEKEYPFQVGGQELAAVPMITAIILHGEKIGKPINGFIIRRERKKTGLQKYIEGRITDQKIILVDDLINSGKTLLHIISVLEDLNKKAHSFFSIISFKNRFSEKIFLEADMSSAHIFTLSDFDLETPRNEHPPAINFEKVWKFQSPEPSFFHDISKSTPAIDEDKIFFGCDGGHFWALDQKTGQAAWNFQTGKTRSGKSVFSSPVIHENLIYFGSYDGNIYALEKNTGHLKWKYMDADFIGSSPTVASELGLLFIGLEFGLHGKKGGIAGIDLMTGKKKWDFIMQEFVHSSPGYCPEKKVVSIGGNDSHAYMFNAENGELMWKHKCGGPVKASFAFDTSRNLVAFGSFDKNLYLIDIGSGEVKGKFQAEDVIYSTPLISNDRIFFSSLDKNIYCLDLKSGKMNWKFRTNGRIFSSPEIINGNIYFGSNDGVVYEIDTASGKNLSIFQLSERITNKIVFNPLLEYFFVSTFANEIYCLKKTTLTK